MCCQKKKEKIIKSERLRVRDRILLLFATSGDKILKKLSKNVWFNMNRSWFFFFFISEIFVRYIHTYTYIYIFCWNLRLKIEIFFGFILLSFWKNCSRFHIFVLNNLKKSFDLIIIFLFLLITWSKFHSCLFLTKFSRHGNPPSPLHFLNQWNNSDKEINEINSFSFTSESQSRTRKKGLKCASWRYFELLLKLNFSLY